MAKVKSRRISSSFLIGLFILSGTVLLIIVIIWLGATQFTREMNYYVTYVDGSVEGLETGSPVKYQGVPVGSVSKINVAPDGRLIEIVFQMKKDVKYNDSLRVKSELTGIAGGKFLQLYYPSNPEILQIFPKLNFQPAYTYIKSSPSGLEEIEIAAREVVDNLRRFKFYEISNKTIDFLNATTDFFRNPELSDIIANIEESSRKLSGIIDRADTTKILDYLANTGAKLYQTSQDLKEFSEKLNEQLVNMQLDKYVQMAYSRYDTTMMKTQDVIQMIGYRTENVVYSLSETLRQIDLTSRELRRTLNAINDDPSNVFLSNPPPEEK